jgi:hypothetical protein
VKYQSLAVATAILTCVSACSPDHAGPVAANGFDGHVSVDANSYQTYSSYNGYRRARVPEVQFTTNSGVRCRIGPSYPDYDQGIRCWGTLLGTTMNFAGVSAYPYDTETNTMVSNTPVPPDRVTYSFLRHVDDLNMYETYLDEGLTEHTVDPNSYHLLGGGEMVAVTGSSNTLAATSICAVETNNAITCEIRTADDGKTHGFQLSPDGSRTY